MNKQSPSWESDSPLAAPEILHILRDLEFHYSVNKSPALFPNLSQTNPVEAIKTHCNIILPPKPRFSSPSFSLSFSPPRPYMHLSCPHTRHMSSPSHSCWFDHPDNIWWESDMMNVLIVQFPSIPCYLVPFRPIVFWNTLSLYSSHTVRDHDLHPYKRSKILVVCILTCISFESKR